MGVNFPPKGNRPPPPPPRQPMSYYLPKYPFMAPPAPPPVMDWQCPQCGAWKHIFKCPYCGVRTGPPVVVIDHRLKGDILALERGLTSKRRSLDKIGIAYLPKDNFRTK
jgi:hypothetical protein